MTRSIFRTLPRSVSTVARTIAATTVAGAALMAMAGAQAAPVCNTTTQAAGNQTYSINVGGTTRSYRLHIPRNLKSPAAVVLSLHGLSSSASSQQSGSGWDSTSDATGDFIVAYPDGVGRQWNVAGFNPTVDDTAFMKAIVDHVSQRVRIAPNRVFISGTSLGGGFSHKMACTQADYFAGAAPVVFHLHTSPQDYVCAPSRPISVLEYAGRNDLLVRYNGGTSSVAGQTVTHLSANASFEKWARLSGCSGSPQTVWSRLSANNKQYKSCGNGVVVGLASLSCGHGFCADTAFGKPSDDAWKVFKTQTTPGKPADACAP